MRFILWIAGLLMLINFSSCVFSDNNSQEYWLGAYMGQSKIGYASIKISSEKINGRIVNKAESLMKLTMNAMGFQITQHLETNLVADENFSPLEETFILSSGGRKTWVKARFEPSKVVCEIDADGSVTQKILPIPEGKRVVGDSMFAMIGASPKVGEEYSACYFNPLTMAVEDIKIKVEKVEKVVVNDKTYDAYVLRNSAPSGDSVVWQDFSGEIIKAEAALGIALIRETKEQAMSDSSVHTSPDIINISRVLVDKIIPNPRKVKYLCALIKAPQSVLLPISDSRQKVSLSKSDGKDAFNVIVNAKAFNRSKAKKIASEKKEFAQYLAFDAYINDSLEIRQLAMRIKGKAANPWVICSRIRAWLRENIKPETDIGVTRTAQDVLNSRRGVCRDIAILFAALARSLGIPAKIAAGVVYMDGAFYYHVWNECWMGEWVAFDGTLETDFVDALHVKLVEGDATKMYSIARIIGELEIQIISWK